MKLKYYLRGLGLGIIMTTVVLVIVLGNKNQALTNEEIIVKAEELGMAFPKEEEKSKEEPNQKEEVASEGEQVPTPEVTPESETKPEDEVVATPETVPEVKPEEEVKSQPPTSVTLTVGGGDGSLQVASKLVDLGIISDSKSYDDYLVDNGYDMRLQTGTFEIPSGATFEEITKILLKRN